MSTTPKIISEWFDRGIQKKATHMIIVCDTFDYDDYPVYVTQNENISDREKEYNGKEMQKVMEVYNLSMDKQIQLNQTRAFNY